MRRPRCAQSWDPERYARNARFVSDLGMPVVELLAPKAGERILDLGCGDGELSAKIASFGASVVGADSSPELVARARGRGIDTRLMDGHELTFDPEFDAVFSNAALHWMLEPDAVLRGVWRALKPGGRFVGEFGGDGNVATVVNALLAALDKRGRDARDAVPWYFPTAGQYRDRLVAQGFAVEYIALIPRLTALPGAIGGWLETFAESFLSMVPESKRQALIREVSDALRPALYDEKKRVWTVDYVRLRFDARKA